MILCHKCQTAIPAATESELAVCLSCGGDLEQTQIYCVPCSSRLQLCQCCGEPLRLNDFAQIYACRPGCKLTKMDERRIIAMFLHNA